MARFTPENLDNLLEKKIVAWLSTSHTPPEEKAMLEWLHEVPERKRLYDEIRRTWEMVGSYRVNEPPEIVWHNIAAQLDPKRMQSPQFSELVRRSREIISHRPLVFALRAAAVLMVGISLYFSQAYLRVDGRNAIEEKEVVTANGQRQEVKLPDGTVGKSVV